MLRAVPVRGREAGGGQVRADEGVVPRSRQSRSRSQTDEDGEGDPGQTKTVAGEGTGTQTETGTDVDARTGTETENSLGANGLRRLEILEANTGVATVQTSKHNWTQ